MLFDDAEQQRRQLVGVLADVLEEEKRHEVAAVLAGRADEVMAALGGEPREVVQQAQNRSREARHLAVEERQRAENRDREINRLRAALNGQERALHARATAAIRALRAGDADVAEKELEAGLAEHREAS